MTGRGSCGRKIIQIALWALFIPLLPSCAQFYDPLSVPLSASSLSILSEDSPQFTVSVPTADDIFNKLSRQRLTLSATEGHQPEMMDRLSGEDQGPRIPEPMVFDLVRPLGAKRGEAEINVLGLVPLARTTRTVDEVPDPLGLVRRSPDTQGIEWAPEMELVLRDGIAIELELPMENATIEAYKTAGQITFGTEFTNRFIHGAQTILQYDLEPRLWTTTWLYLAGLRLDETWSVFGMFGPRAEIGNAVGGANVELLSNLTLFAGPSHHLVAGIETNFGQVIGGHASLLVMPQLHYEVSDDLLVQAGVGARLTHEFTLPTIGFRLIHEF